MEEQIKPYKILIVDTYIDKDTGLLAKNFGKTLEVPTEISDERAKDMISKKIAKVVKDDKAKTESTKNKS